MPEHPASPPDPNRVRDHLANERTYLAWMRTGANVMVLGLAIAKLVNHENAESLAAGAILVLVGTLAVAFGTLRYRQTAEDIEAARYGRMLDSRAAVVSSVVLVVSIAAALVLLLAGGN